MKNLGTQFNLRDPMLTNCSPAIYQQAIEYLKATGDTNGFIVMLKGA